MQRCVKINRFTKIEAPCSIYANTNINSSSIGRGTFVSEMCFLPTAFIGRFTSIGRNVRIILGDHPTKGYVSTSPVFYSNAMQSGMTFVSKSIRKDTLNMVDDNYSIKIGNDVWIGNDVSIFSGVTIHDGAIIAAGAIVNKDVEPYEIVGGMPAKHIRYRHTQEQRALLLQDAWWNKSIEELDELKDLMQDVESYCEHIKSQLP